MIIGGAEQCACCAARRQAKASHILLCTHPTPPHPSLPHLLIHHQSRPSQDAGCPQLIGLACILIVISRLDDPVLVRAGVGGAHRSLTARAGCLVGVEGMGGWVGGWADGGQLRWSPGAVTGAVGAAEDMSLDDDQRHTLTLAPKQAIQVLVILHQEAAAQR